MDKDIWKAFYDGTNEVFNVLFNSGTKDDGVLFYPIYEPSNLGVYKEVKQRKYLVPISLIAKVELTPTQGEEDVETIKETAVFTIPFKSLNENGVNMSNKNFPQLRKGKIQFKDTFYEIDNIKPKTFVENTFMFYQFECTEDLKISEIVSLDIPVVVEGKLIYKFLPYIDEQQRLIFNKEPKLEDTKLTY